MRYRLAVLLGASVLVGACGRSGGTPPGAAWADVDGRTFLSTAVTADGADRPVVPGSTLRLTFGDRRVTANAGCNTMSGEVRIDGGRMVVTKGLATTEMGCPEALMAQDRWLADLLTGGAAITVRGDRMTLTAGGTVISMQDERTLVPDAPLVMTEWILDTIVAGDTASSVPHGVSATLAFGSGQPRAFVQTGCNAGSGAVEIGTASMTFGPIALTRRACADESASAVESAIVSVLQGEVSFDVDGRKLTVTKGDRSLVYRAR